MLIENFTVNLGKFWGNLDVVNLGKFWGNFGHDLGILYWLELATLILQVKSRTAREMILIRILFSFCA